MSEYLLEAGEWNRVTPTTAGWRDLFFEVRRGPFSSLNEDVEVVLVPLSGSWRVRAGDRSWELGGRASVTAWCTTWRRAVV